MIVTGLTADSRKVRAGVLFAALPGALTDGARFARNAAEAGAAAILATASAELGDIGGVPVIRSDNPRRTLALLAARFFAGQPQTIVAVTGTQGKTSIASFVRQIWAGMGLQAASLGTIGLVRPDGAVTDSLTTPEPVELHQMLAQLSHEGVTHLAMEASSHGLEQHRLDGVRLQAAAFNNIGHDHLDYHKDFEDYFTQKRRLFRDLLPAGATAVVNSDAARHEDIIEDAYARHLKVMTVGRKGKSIRIESLDSEGFGQRLKIRNEGESYDLLVPLIGGYQAENALMAAALTMASGCPPEGAFAQLERLKGVPGRLEMVGGTRGGMVVVDYAHKPDALRAALVALRPFVTGKLICIFGCGGDRDKAKRPMMGAIATELADLVIVTDDNPRTEVAAQVRSEILNAAPGAKEIGDRHEAIFAGVAMLMKGDVLVVAGKGHETGQYINGVVHPFSDHEVVRDALAREGADV